MKKNILFAIFISTNYLLMTQQIMTPEILWSLKRVDALGISIDGKHIIFKSATPDIKENKSVSKFYQIDLDGTGQMEIQNHADLILNKNISPDGNYELYTDEVKIEHVWGKDFYPEMKKSNVQVYNSLNYRHWDTWNEGKYNHPFYKKVGDTNKKGIDIMPNVAFDCPTKPFGGDEDMIWSPDSKKIMYVTKKLSGTDYAKSTNTDIFEYNIETKTTKNLTETNKGYDVDPAFSPKGELTWLQMKRDGYEADKNDIILSVNGNPINLTAHWDGTVQSFKWNKDGSKIYFLAAVGGTQQLFSIDVNRTEKPTITQVIDGEFDVNGMIDIIGDEIFLTRNTMQRASEIYSYNLSTKIWKQITRENDEIYSTLSPSKSEKRWVATKNGLKMCVWVVYPPGFDKSKKYPTLLYCQGGPQSALTHFHSYRWNLNLIASQGYIVVAPNRRGMPGHGVKWNEDISKDWGGKVMDDYLAAIDDVSLEAYVDKTRRGAVGASYGGYSVFYLAGIHKNRFKSFISHCGIFNMESMYGTTEEVFFTNWDMGGNYWDKSNAAAQKTYTEFNPIKLVDKWNTPILIFQGAKDYRVPIGQAQEAFQAAQLRGIKSRFILFNDENHWITKPQNALIWQGEFFKWLKETL
jgi:dipeptidyl aminopeptidase/acylaminoacyl peptidase